MACCGGRALEAKLLGVFISLPFSGGGHLGKIWIHPSAMRSPGQTTIQVGSQPHPSVNRLPKDPSGTQPPLISPRDKAPPTKGIGISPTYQWAGISPSHKEAYSKSLYQLQPQGAATRSKRLPPYCLQKGDHTKNLYKMKRQRITTQIREFKKKT